MKGCLRSTVISGMKGLSIKHNPEFTMMEFYMAYATYEDLMLLTEEVFGHVLDQVIGSRVIQYQGNTIDFTPPWKRVSLFRCL